MSFQQKKRRESIYSSRIISLGEITVENVKDVINDILEIIEEDNKKKQKKPIQLIINSPGGDLYAGFGLVDVICNSSTPIHTICYGHAMSAAFFIFVTGHVRFAGKHATFMYHDSWYCLEANTTTHLREIEEGKRTVNMMDDIIVNHTKLSKETLNDIREKHINKYFTAEEALELNIIDEIL